MPFSALLAAHALPRLSLTTSRHSRARLPASGTHTLARLGLVGGCTQPAGGFSAGRPAGFRAGGARRLLVSGGTRRLFGRRESSGASARPAGPRRPARLAHRLPCVDWRSRPPMRVVLVGNDVKRYTYSGRRAAGRLAGWRVPSDSLMARRWTTLSPKHSARRGQAGLPKPPRRPCAHQKQPGAQKPAHREGAQARGHAGDRSQPEALRGAPRAAGRHARRRKCAA